MLDNIFYSFVRYRIPYEVYPCINASSVFNTLVLMRGLTGGSVCVKTRNHIKKQILEFCKQ